MNKAALITGGSRGIGLGIAIELAKEGFDLAINGVRPEDQVVETLEMLRSYGRKVIYCQGNISIQKDRSAIVGKIKAEYGKLNIPCWDESERCSA